MRYFQPKYWVWWVLLGSLILRLPLLTGSFWLDEAAQALESIRPFSQQLDIVPDFQPPLLHFITHFAAQLSHSEWWLRWWGALVPGLITIWATYKLGEMLFGKRVALISSLLLATSSFHIFYSQELRPYSLPACWALLSTLMIFQKPFSWPRFTIVTLLGLYSSYLYPFLLLPQLWLIWQREKTTSTLAKIGGGLVVGIAPLLPLFWQQLHAGQTLRNSLPGWETVVSTSQLKTLALVPLKFLYGVMDLELTPLFLITGFALAGVALWWFVTHKTTQSSPAYQRSMRALLLLLIVPFITSWLISFWIPVVQPKRLLYLLPFFSLLLSVPLGRSKITPRPATLFVGLALLLNIIGTGQYWTQPQLQRENWRGLKETIAANFSPTQTIAVFSFDEAFAPWRWYEPPVLQALATGNVFINNVDDLNNTLKPLADFQYVLVFDYLRTLTDPDDRLLSAVESFGFTNRGVLDYPGIGFVRVYTRPEGALGFAL